DAPEAGLEGVIDVAADGDARADALRAALGPPDPVRGGDVVLPAQLHAHARTAVAAEGQHQIADQDRRRIRESAALEAQAVAPPEDLAVLRRVGDQAGRHRAEDLVLPVDLADEGRRPGAHELPVLVLLARALERLFLLPDRLARRELE